MFNGSYFAASYFAARYFCEIGAAGHPGLPAAASALAATWTRSHAFAAEYRRGSALAGEWGDA